jgi:putative restriction endonuclease
MQQILIKYLNAFKKLRVDRSHGVAPHKPILLISILQSFHKNQILDKKIYITPELVSLFKTNWNLLVTSKHDCRISYPFYYLKSDKFWKLIAKNEFDDIEKMGQIMKSFNNLNSVIKYAEIDEELFILAKDNYCNNILQEFLLDEYFNETKSNLIRADYEQNKLFNDIELKILNDDPGEYKNEILELKQQNDEESIFLRGSIFKREVPKIYNNTCCISGMKIDSTLNISMIDACHIVPFSQCYDDTITNGIALCPNLHRAFDRGLITIDNNYQVVISDIFKETESNYSICKFDRKKIQLPVDKEFFPSKINLEWHIQNVFKS